MKAATTLKVPQQRSSKFEPTDDGANNDRPLDGGVGAGGYGAIVSVLTELADAYTAAGDDLRAKAFRNASKTMETYDGTMDQKSLVAAPGLGPSSAKEILEINKTGKSKRLDKLLNSN